MDTLVLQDESLSETTRYETLYIFRMEGPDDRSPATYHFEGREINSIQAIDQGTQNFTQKYNLKMEVNGRLIFLGTEYAIESYNLLKSIKVSMKTVDLIDRTVSGILIKDSRAMSLIFELGSKERLKEIIGQENDFFDIDNSQNTNEFIKALQKNLRTTELNFDSIQSMRPFNREFFYFYFEEKNKQLVQRVSDYWNQNINQLTNSQIAEIYATLCEFQGLYSAYWIHNKGYKSILNETAEIMKQRIIDSILPVLCKRLSISLDSELVTSNDLIDKVRSIMNEDLLSNISFSRAKDYVKCILQAFVK